MEKYTLNEVMTISEAAEIYNLNIHTIKNKLKKSLVGQEKIDRWVKKGLARQSGNTWLVTKDFIEINFKLKLFEAENN